LDKPPVGHTWIDRKGKEVLLYGRYKNGNKRLLLKFYLSYAVKQGYAFGSNICFLIDRKGNLSLFKTGGLESGKK